MRRASGLPRAVAWVMPRISQAAPLIEVMSPSRVTVTSPEERQRIVFWCSRARSPAYCWWRASRSPARWVWPDRFSPRAPMVAMAATLSTSRKNRSEVDISQGNTRLAGHRGQQAEVAGQRHRQHEQGAGGGHVGRAVALGQQRHRDHLDHEQDGEGALGPAGGVHQHRDEQADRPRSAGRRSPPGARSGAAAGRRPRWRRRPPPAARTGSGRTPAPGCRWCRG